MSADQATQWDDFWKSRHRTRLGHILLWGRKRFVSRGMVRFLLHHTEPGGVLVEAGCGTGEVVLEVARTRGDQVILVDVSREALRKAESDFALAGLHARTLECDIAALHLALPTVEKGTVFNIGVIEHFADCTAVLRPMAAVAGRKALAIVPEHSLFWSTFVALSRRLRLVPQGFFIVLYDEKSLCSVVQQAGLRPIRVTRIRIAGIITYLAVEFQS